MSETPEYGHKKITILSRSAEPVVVQMFCECGDEFFMQHAITVGDKTTYHYKCNCGRKHQADEVFPRVELILPSRDGMRDKTVYNLPIALYSIHTPTES